MLLNTLELVMARSLLGTGLIALYVATRMVGEHDWGADFAIFVPLQKIRQSMHEIRQSIESSRQEAREGVEKLRQEMKPLDTKVACHDPKQVGMCAFMQTNTQIGKTGLLQTTVLLLTCLQCNRTVLIIL